MASRGGQRQGFGGMPMGGGGKAPAKPRSQSPPGRANADDEFKIEDLERLDKTMVLVAALGLIVNIVQVTAISNHAWLKATALSGGQPFTGHLSLASVRFGNATAASRDNAYFCPGTRGGECSLAQLCAKEVAGDVFPNGAPKNTPQEAWCRASDAGSSATKLLFMGLLLGLGATGLTGMYAAQSIPWVADQFDKVEEMGFSDEIQKYFIFAGWVALWLFIFSSMVFYATMIPDSLGWGVVTLEASFGLVRVSFVLSSINLAIVSNSVFHIWGDDAMGSAWKQFMDTPWLSFTKALYIQLALQLALYFTMIVSEVDWAVLLVVIAFIYIGSGQRSFMIMYLTIIIISILFDTIKLLSLPSFAAMTPGEAWGNGTWMAIYVLKFLNVGTIVAHEYYESPTSDAHDVTDFGRAPKTVAASAVKVQPGRSGAGYGQLNDDTYDVNA